MSIFMHDLIMNSWGFSLTRVLTSHGQVPTVCLACLHATWEKRRNDYDLPTRWEKNRNDGVFSPSCLDEGDSKWCEIIIIYMFIFYAVNLLIFEFFKDFFLGLKLFGRRHTGIAFNHLLLLFFFGKMSVALVCVIV